MRMRQKLIASFVLTVIVPILAISIVSISQTKTESLERFIDSSNSEIRQVENTFNLFFDQMKNNARFLAQSSTVTSVSENTSTYFDAEKMMDPRSAEKEEAEMYKSHVSGKGISARKKRGSVRDRMPHVILSDRFEAIRAEVEKRPHAGPFLKPVSRVHLPQYYEVS